MSNKNNNNCSIIQDGKGGRVLLPCRALCCPHQICLLQNRHPCRPHWNRPWHSRPHPRCACPPRVSLPRTTTTTIAPVNSMLHRGKNESRLQRKLCWNRLRSNSDCEDWVWLISIMEYPSVEQRSFPKQENRPNLCRNGQQRQQQESPAASRLEYWKGDSSRSLVS